MDIAQLSNDLHQIFGRSMDSVVVTSLSDEILYANPPALRLLCRLQDHHGYLPPVLHSLEGTHDAVRVADLAGTELYLEIKSQNIVWRDSQVKLITVCDRTRVMQRQRELEQLVYRDELTGLHNRRGMDIEVRRLQSQAIRQNKKLHVLFIDVNGLKQINDRLGHHMGDAALLETADVIRRGFGAETIAARIGGDEFALFLLEDSEQSIQQSVVHLQDCLDNANSMSERPYRLALSIGMSQYSPGQIFDFKQLMLQADQNMYRAKSKRDPASVVPDYTRASLLHLAIANTAEKMEEVRIYA